MEDFKVEFIDHVAIRVKNMEHSVLWYEKVFGFKRYQPEEWGAFPIMLFSGKSGIAFFPANLEDPEIDRISKNVNIDHFAFNVTNENFEKAKVKLNHLSIEFEEKNHHYFKSIYINDPDKHTVELTTILVDGSDFYT